MRRRVAVWCIPIVPGIRIGNAQDLNGMTGITVVLCEEGSKVECALWAALPVQEKPTL